MWQYFTPITLIVKLFLKLIKMRPDFTIKIKDGNITNMIDKNYNFPPYNINWQIRYLQIEITNSILRPDISIVKVSYPIRNLKNNIILNNPSHDGYLHIFPLKENWEKSDKISIIKSDTSNLYAIYEIPTLISENGEYELEVKITGKTSYNKEITKFATKKFIIKDGKGEWTKCPT